MRSVPPGPEVRMRRRGASPTGPVSGSSISRVPNGAAAVDGDLDAARDEDRHGAEDVAHVQGRLRAVQGGLAEVEVDRAARPRARSDSRASAQRPERSRRENQAPCLTGRSAEPAVGRSAVIASQLVACAPARRARRGRRTRRASGGLRRSRRAGSRSRGSGRRRRRGSSRQSMRRVLSWLDHHPRRPREQPQGRRPRHPEGRGSRSSRACRGRGSPRSCSTRSRPSRSGCSTRRCRRSCRASCRTTGSRTRTCSRS